MVWQRAAQPGRVFEVSVASSLPVSNSECQEMFVRLEYKCSDTSTRLAPLL